MKAINVIIGLFVVVVLFSLFLTGIHNSRITQYSQTVPGVATGIGNTSANIVLTEPLFNDSIPSIKSIVSSYSDSAEAPAPSSYNSSTKTLTVIGLAQSQTRNPVITYEYGSLDRKEK